MTTHNNTSPEGDSNHTARAGIALMVCAGLAMALANSPWQGIYESMLSAPVTVLFGEAGLTKPAVLWINDGLMAMFFLLVGLELKREVLSGSLSRWRDAALPAVAAIGGIAVPALIYGGFNWDDAVAIQGWAIPAATDIAFALGVLALLGSSVPAALKVFLMVVAVIDDLGAIAIIALFYTDALTPLALAVAAGCVAALVALNRLSVRALAPYLMIGIVLWVSVLKSGVHATLAGVVLAAFIPAGDARDGPAARLEHGLHEWGILLVLPVFAFANAGVSFVGTTLDTLLGPVPLGIAAGSVVGKTVGVFSFALLAIHSGLSSPLPGVNRLQLLGVSKLCGIGFTMSLFIGVLAFDPGLADLGAQVKLGILSGSVVAGILGYTLLRYAAARRREAEPAKAPVGQAA